MQSEKQNFSDQKRWYKKWWAIAILFIVLLGLILFVAFFFYIINLSKQIKSDKHIISQSYFASQKKYQAEGINNYWTGTSTPQITIVEFADFNCPICRNSYQVIRKISLNNKDNIKLIFRDYPVVTDSSVDLAMSARCAGAQGKFWEMHDRLFQNQGKFNPKSKDEIVSLALKTGIDLNKFLICMNSKKYQTDIAKDLSDGEHFEITGTPTWFINGYKISGEIPEETFNKIIEIFKKKYE